MELKHTATRDGRLSSFLKDEMKMSTGLVNRLKWQEKIFVNGAPQHNDFSIRAGDVITALLDEEEPNYPPQDGQLQILYEDEHILAVDKPAGMLIHPSHSKNDGTLANFVLGYYVRTGQKCAFHPVTRLDRDTFGIVLLTKNSHIHALMQQTELRKTYHALVSGDPAEDAGTIDAPIARKLPPSLLREVHPDGKRCITEFQVLQRLEGYSKLALIPVTGRTHQLRVHCAYMSCPILGDPQYGNGSADFGLTHQLLCAKRLEFTHPITGASMILESNMEAQI
ncbi:MAG: RluA family pseudouridine synthase [Oscillospiraceae bacterium]|nr:RluA family pseudouridine synthase [Oscillospiraceae bacterium]